MKFISAFLSSLLMVQPVHAAKQYHLIMTVDVLRHGDRTPIGTIPKAPHEWPIGLGQLTAEGMYQACELGKSMRQRYVTEAHLLPANYDPATLLARSTDVDRTLMTGTSLLTCLYPLKTGPKRNDTEYGLPEGQQPIPIHTVARATDNLLLPTEVNSKEYHELEDRYVYSQAEWVDKQKQMEEKFKRWEQATGFKLKKLNDISDLGDTLFIYKLYHIEMPAELSKEDIEEIISLADWVHVQRFKPAVIGDFFIHDFLQQLKIDLANGAKEGNKLKSILYFAHDTTLLGFMSGLHVPLKTSPSYVSNLRFELLADDQNQPWVRVYYNGKLQSLPACKEICTLDDFIKNV